MLEIKSLSHIKSKGGGPRPQSWAVSTFRGQTEEEGPGEEREKEWSVRLEGNQQGGGEARGKGVSRRAGPSVLDSAEFIIGFSEMGSG